MKFLQFKDFSNIDSRHMSPIGRDRPKLNKLKRFEVAKSKLSEKL